MSCMFFLIYYELYYEPNKSRQQQESLWIVVSFLKTCGSQTLVSSLWSSWRIVTQIQGIKSSFWGPVKKCVKAVLFLVECADFFLENFNCCSSETKAKELVVMTQLDVVRWPRLEFHMPFPCSRPSPLQIEISSGTTQDGTDYSRISKCLQQLNIFCWEFAVHEQARQHFIPPQLNMLVILAASIFFRFRYVSFSVSAQIERGSWRMFNVLE